MRSRLTVVAGVAAVAVVLMPAPALAATWHAPLAGADVFGTLGGLAGGVLSDTSATSLRDQALAALQAENPNVQVDFTLAVAPNGLGTATVGAGTG